MRNTFYLEVQVTDTDVGPSTVSSWRLLSMHLINLGNPELAKLLGFKGYNSETWVRPFREIKGLPRPTVVELGGMSIRTFLEFAADKEAHDRKVQDLLAMGNMVATWLSVEELEEISNELVVRSGREDRVLSLTIHAMKKVEELCGGKARVVYWFIEHPDLNT